MNNLFSHDVLVTLIMIACSLASIAFVVADAKFWLNYYNRIKRLFRL